MQHVIRFTTLIVLMEVVTAVSIKLCGGHPFDSMSGWKGIGALILLVAAVAVIAGGLWALGKGNFDNEVLLGLVGGGTGAILLLSFVGLKWLTGPMRDLADGGAIWWPVLVLIACLITWFARLSRR